MAASLRFAIRGPGFWARYQPAGWREFAGVECVALCNRTRGKADVLASVFGVTAVYDNAEAMLQRTHLVFGDIITGVDTHSELVHADECKPEGAGDVAIYSPAMPPTRKSFG